MVAITLVFFSFCRVVRIVLELWQLAGDYNPVLPAIEPAARGERESASHCQENADGHQGEPEQALRGDGMMRRAKPAKLVD